jgi:hypothetical protein
MGLKESAFLNPLSCQFWAEVEKARHSSKQTKRRFISQKFRNLNYEKRTKAIGNIVQEKESIP